MAFSANLGGWIADTHTCEQRFICDDCSQGILSFPFPHTNSDNAYFENFHCSFFFDHAIFSKNMLSLRVLYTFIKSDAHEEFFISMN